MSRFAMVALTAVGVIALTTAAPPVETDRKLEDAVRAAMKRGAEIYNSGDVDGTCQFFKGALETLRPLLVDRKELVRTIDSGLANTSKQADHRNRALVLRTALDELRRMLAEESTKAKPT